MVLKTIMIEKRGKILHIQRFYPILSFLNQDIGYLSSNRLTEKTYKDVQMRENSGNEKDQQSIDCQPW